MLLFVRLNPLSESTLKLGLCVRRVCIFLILLLATKQFTLLTDIEKKLHNQSNNRFMRACS